jgi:hypothetical protein
MANRAMTAKVERARKQAREAAQLEFTKPTYILQTPKSELRATASGLGAMHRIPSARTEPRQARFYGDGMRRGSILTADVYSTETKLIRAHK